MDDMHIMVKPWRIVATAVAIATGLTLGAAWQDPAHGDDTPGCATHDEYDQIDVMMKPWRVAEIVGNDGWFVDTPNPDTFARGYRSCWAPGERMVRVWFDEVSGFSIRKDILDVA